MPPLPAVLTAIFEKILNSGDRFSVQDLEAAARANGATWREARYQLEQWRLARLVVPTNGATRTRVTYWRKK